MSSWNHDSVFEELFRQHGGRSTRAGRYAYLYRQSPNCAVLYESRSPDAKVRRAPLHLRLEAPSWDAIIGGRITPFVSPMYRDSGKATRFDWCSIRDWDGLAGAIGLDVDTREIEAPVTEEHQSATGDERFTMKPEPRATGTNERLREQFIRSAWEVSRCDRIAAYGESDYDRYIYRLKPTDAPGSTEGLTPPDVGFLGRDYRGILFIGMNPGRGASRGPNEREYFRLVSAFRDAPNVADAVPRGRSVFAEESRLVREDPWHQYSSFILPVLTQASALSGLDLGVETIARLNVARSKTVADSAGLSDRLAEICFLAHTPLQLALLRPRVVICRYSRTSDWITRWARESIDNVSVITVPGRVAARADIKAAAKLVASVL
jgi:hypothetical protein